jgi:hypothetical protein
MNGFRHLSRFAALLAALLLLGLDGRRAVFCSGLAGDANDPLAAARQFYARVLGNWVGTTVSRVNDDAPVTGYFHLVVSRVDENTFREEYLFYRVLPTTGALERSGTRTYLSTIASDGAIRRTSRGSGTILVNSIPRNQSFEASGEVYFTGPDRLESKAQGKIAVEGLPWNAGKNGKLRKATATVALEEEKLIGRMRFEASFRVLFFRKRFRIESQLRGQRGNNVQVVAGRVAAP